MLTVTLVIDRLHAMRNKNFEKIKCAMRGIYAGKQQAEENTRTALMNHDKCTRDDECPQLLCEKLSAPAGEALV